MPLKFRHLEESYLTATARFERWRARFEAMMFEEVGIEAIQVMIDTLTPAQREKLRATNPALYDRIMQES